MRKNIAFFQKNHSYVVTISQLRVINNISGVCGRLSRKSPYAPCQGYITEMLFGDKRNEPTIRIGFVYRCRTPRSDKQKMFRLPVRG